MLAYLPAFRTSSQLPDSRRPETKILIYFSTFKPVAHSETYSDSRSTACLLSYCHRHCTTTATASRLHCLAFRFPACLLTPANAC